MIDQLGPFPNSPRISELPPPALVRCLKEPPFLPPTRTIKGMAYDDLAKDTYPGMLSR
ncbi:uncharacterized protein BO87DRAFT_57703 [Aspergillus neoniger CBS 115656]|uniref:Uncharacterized protein n=1 Tax=Aspergillus neoniger (strain CBS 115656) TaxID=1448310 RepID=A0A318Z2G3_ASPNB|nr:hypothetical protein BO87DRAFT_57703 [Aspergillus neoniger CBS 115656]PYH34358.1 hypothetical protein BO87DRAFT_57703 [Aspergillus neoniger CBS 115656]